MKNGRNTCLNCGRVVNSAWPALCKHNCLDANPPRQFFNGLLVERKSRRTTPTGYFDRQRA